MLTAEVEMLKGKGEQWRAIFLSITKPPPPPPPPKKKKASKTSTPNKYKAGSWDDSGQLAMKGLQIEFERATRKACSKYFLFGDAKGFAYIIFFTTICTVQCLLSKRATLKLILLEWKIFKICANLLRVGISISCNTKNNLFWTIFFAIYDLIWLVYPQKWLWRLFSAVGEKKESNVA